jgi:Bacterial SH3 domain
MLIVSAGSFRQASRQRLGAAGRVWQLCIAPALFLLLCGVGFGRTREKAAPSFTIEVDEPFSRVLAVVEDVARSSVIKGTFEYAGDDQLTGAQFETSSRLFPVWTAAGKVFFKVRNRTLAPKHFIQSNDVGSVAVRYVVQENGARSTRLVIDAVFVENAGHHGHPSDGYVETCEFAEIGKRLKEFDQQRTLRASGHEFSPSRESSSQPDKPVEKEADSSATADIRRAIAEQESQLAADTANLQQLEAQARKLRASEFVRVSAERAELKASPYSHARVVTALKQGQEVTVLIKSAYWFRVRSEDGQEGWVFHSALEAQP